MQKRASVEDVNKTLHLIEYFKDNGALTAPLYHKCILTLASECMNLNDSTQSMYLLGKIPDKYFDEDLIVQLQEDVVFANSVKDLVGIITTYGVWGVTVH